MVGNIDGANAFAFGDDLDSDIEFDVADEAAYADNVVAFPEAVPHKYAYLQIRPRLASLTRCVAQLEQIIESHPQAGVEIVGLSATAHRYLLTLALDLGPAHKIADYRDDANATAIAAFYLADAIFTKMFDHLPVYGTAPTAEEQVAVEEIASLLALQTPGAVAI